MSARSRAIARRDEPPPARRGAAAPAVLHVRDVSGALDAARLHMRFQPIVSARDRRPVALEVLARLDHPILGMLFPDQFIPQVEDAGLIRRLTVSVVDAALAEHALHLAALPVALTLNVPLDVLMRDDTVGWLDGRCAAARLPPTKVIVELTESQPVAALNADGRRTLQGAMARLRARGYRLAIDDFGPDMPRRQALFALPLDLLKLDKSIVVDPAATPIVAEAIRMSRQHGLRVIAEGVEDEATWSRMQTLGVDYIQGFLVSRPLPAADVAGWKRRWSGESGQEPKRYSRSRI